MKPRHRARSRTGEVLSEEERKFRAMNTKELENSLHGCLSTIGVRLFGIPPGASPETREYVLTAADRAWKLRLDAIVQIAVELESEYVRRGMTLPDAGEVQVVINQYVAARLIFAATAGSESKEVVH